MDSTLKRDWVKAGPIMSTPMTEFGWLRNGAKQHKSARRSVWFIGPSALGGESAGLTTAQPRSSPIGRNEVIGFVGTVEDITDRKHAEDAVRRERDFAERLIEAAQAIVLVLDRDGRIVRFNSFLERVTGRSPDEVRGADWFATFLNHRDRPLARAAFERALSDASGAATSFIRSSSPTTVSARSSGRTSFSPEWSAIPPACS